jgi:excisionase family DNA binding protein
MFSASDFLQIREAATLLNISEQTLRNWDKAGKLRAHRHPINGYRLYKVSDLHKLIGAIKSSQPLAELPEFEQLNLLDVVSQSIRPPTQKISSLLPPCHWSPEVALDPRHRPQNWDSPASTVRRDWRKYPQEAHVLNREGTAYRRLLPDEIALLQGFPREIVDVIGLTNREKIAALGDAVPPPLSRVILSAINDNWHWQNQTALEICAGIGGLAEGAASIGLEHVALIDSSPICGRLLKNGRRWPESVVHVADVRKVDYSKYRRKIGLFSGGPPCQPWSQSGQRLGNLDERDLLGHLDRLIAVVEPEVFVFENVPGLASIANHDYLSSVIMRLRKPGPSLSYGVLIGQLNAADYGVPQLRNRLFIIGFRGLPSSFVSKLFNDIENRATHINPSLSHGKRAPWLTIAETLRDSDTGSGWRRWVGR